MRYKTKRKKKCYFSKNQMKFCLQKLYDCKFSHLTFINLYNLLNRENSKKKKKEFKN